MEAYKADVTFEAISLLQEKTPLQNPEMDKPTVRSSKRLREKQKHGKKDVGCQKCLTFQPEVTKTRRAKKRKSIQEDKEKAKKSKANNDAHSLSEYQNDLSEYQLERLKNIRQNQAFLNSLNLSEFTEALRPKAKASQRGLKREKTKVEVLPVRKSLRLQKKKPQKSAVSEAISSSHEELVRKAKPTGPIPLDPINLDEDFKLPNSLLRLWNDVPQKQHLESSDLKSYHKMLKRLAIDKSCVVKAVNGRVCSAAFHPSTTLLIAAGDNTGHLGLWKPNANWGDDGVVCFEPHFGAINCMAFSLQPCNLITVSYDGFARSMDLEKAVFDEVYHSSSGLKGFDFLSSDGATLLIVDMDGDVAVVDRRARRSSISLYGMMTHPLRSVQVHPEQKYYFLVAEGRSANVYDVRNLKRTNSQSVCELSGHGLSVSSAFFSPVSGSRVLTTCMDDRIRIFDTRHMAGRIPMLNSINYNMYTGRWLSKLSAVWDPKQQDCFVIGNVQRPRRIQVYHESGDVLHSFQNQEHLTTVCSIAAFHPTRNVLLGGNSTGKMHIFTDSFIN